MTTQIPEHPDIHPYILLLLSVCIFSGIVFSCEAGLMEGGFGRRDGLGGYWGYRGVLEFRQLFRHLFRSSMTALSCAMGRWCMGSNASSSWLAYRKPALSRTGTELECISTTVTLPVSAAAQAPNGRVGVAPSRGLPFHVHTLTLATIALGPSSIRLGRDGSSPPPSCNTLLLATS